MQYLYCVAGLNILCSIPFPFTIQREAIEFLHPLSEDAEIIQRHPDLTVHFHPAVSLPAIAREAYYTQDRYYHRTEDGLTVHFCSAPGMEPFACAMVKDRGQYVDCAYLSGNETRLLYSRCITDFLCMEALFLHHGGFMLHASFIRWKRKGILFSAPSGTGKSTQAELWKQYDGAEILNGDRAVLRRVHNCWRSYGLPFAGSSGIYRNESAPVAAVVVLRQAKENHIRKLSPVEAIQNLYPEVILHRWDRMDVNLALNLLQSLVSEVPVLLLECLPEASAVELLKDALHKYEHREAVQ